MQDPKLTRTSIHADVFEVSNLEELTAEDVKPGSVVIRLRNAIKRDGDKNTTVAQRGNQIFVMTSDDGREALKERLGARSKSGLSMQRLLSEASQKA